MSLYRRVGGLTILITVLTLLAWACGGGGGEFLIDRTTPTPTGTPAIFQRSPVAGAASPTAAASPTGSPVASPTAAQSPVAGANVTPEANPFEITVNAENSGLRIRERPSASDDSTVLGSIFQGEKAKVIGQARGQEVEPGKGDVWYQIEITIAGELVRGFVYAPFVEKVQ